MNIFQHFRKIHFWLSVEISNQSGRCYVSSDNTLTLCCPVGGEGLLVTSVWYDQGQNDSKRPDFGQSY